MPTYLNLGFLMYQHYHKFNFAAVFNINTLTPKFQNYNNKNDTSINSQKTQSPQSLF